MAGRRSSLTDTLRVELERELAAGTPISIAAERAGVGRRTLTRWLADGRVVRRHLAAAGSPITHVDEFAAPAMASERLDEDEAGLVAWIAQAAARGNWRAACWLLERRWPERWGPVAARRPPEHERELVRPLADDDPFREVDELARRRRGRTDDDTRR